MEKLLPKLRFPEFKGDWEVCKISDLGEVITGSTPSTSNENFYNGDYLFVSPFDINSGRWVIETKTTLTFAGFSKGRKIRKGSTMFVCIGSTIGKIAQNKIECITNQQINTIVPINNDEDFIYSLLENHSPKIRMLAAEQAVPLINKTTFSSYILSVPNLEEQTKIATFLSAVDEKLNLLKEKKALLEDYKKGMMQKIFSQELRFKDENGKDFEKWKKIILSKVFDYKKGNGLSKDKLDFEGVNSCILYGELYTKYSEVIFEVKSKTNSNEGLLSEKGDLLIPSSTTTSGIDLANVTALNFDNVLLGGDITILRSNQDVDSVFYAYYLSNHKKEEIASYAQGITIVHLYYSHIKDMVIDLPSLAEQTKIATFLSAIDEKIELVTQQIEDTQDYKKGLLQQMFC
jgi:type I restriction enzyme, S subunit